MRTPSKGDSSSPGTTPPSDSPTLIDIPGPGTPVPSSDSPTMVDIPGNSPDSPTMVDIPGPDSPTMIEGVSPLPGKPPAWKPRAQASPAMLEPGQLLGQRYEVLQILGEGGMGAVYKARDVELNRMVALKVIRPDLATNQSIIDRFKQELLLATQVTHKNVIRIYDLSEADGMKFITMEYVEGEDLRGLMQKKGKLAPEEAVEIMQQTCRALEAAHSAGIIHRDLKPQNIMLGKDDHVFVSDFGLAKSLGEVGGMTQSGDMLGTPRYMAPEQVDAKHVDARTDIYALGLIFYEMLTGDVPFTAETTLQLMYKRAHETPPAPKTIAPNIPDWLNNIIMTCLERDPANRYQSAQEILDDVDAQRKPEASGVVIPFVPAAQAVGKTKRRYIWIAFSAIVVGLAIGGWLLFARRAHTLTEKDTIILADFTNKTGDPVFDDTLKQALAVGLSQSPFLNILSDGKVRATLGQMNRPAARKGSTEVVQR